MQAEFEEKKKKLFAEEWYFLRIFYDELVKIKEEKK